MEYSTADYLTGIGQKAFVAELMPRYPVYANLLPDSARAVIGEVHDDTRAARSMLEQEGFRYEGYVDIFDAGPTLECFRDDIRAVRRSAVLPVHARRGGPGAGQPDRRRPLARRQPPLRRLPRDPRARAVAHRPLSAAALRRARRWASRDGDTVRAVPLSHEGPYATAR